MHLWKQLTGKRSPEEKDYSGNSRSIAYFDISLQVKKFTWVSTE